MTTGKTIALTRQTFVGKVMSLLFNMLSTGREMVGENKIESKMWLLVQLRNFSPEGSIITSTKWNKSYLFLGLDVQVRAEDVFETI